jgi:hypothetical protein
VTQRDVSRKVVLLKADYIQQSRAGGQAAKQSVLSRATQRVRSVTAEVKGKYVLCTRDRVTDKLVAGQY